MIQFRQSPPFKQIPFCRALRATTAWGAMDKIAALREILEMDPKNSFARYGIAMELVGQNQTEAALKEFDTLLKIDPNYTAGYFMSAQTLVSVGRTQEAKERLTEGIGCAARSGNSHALNEMQSMLDDLGR